MVPILEFVPSAADGFYEEVVRLQETLCDLKRQFQAMQLKDVDKDQMCQRALYKNAQKVRRTQKLLLSIVLGFSISRVLI